MFATGWQYREYVDSNGTVERWHVRLVDPLVYNCERITYPTVEAMERALAATQRSVDLIETDPEASEGASREAAIEQSTRFGTFHNAEAAVAFFAEGRAQATSAAYDIVAAVDSQSDADNSK